MATGRLQKEEWIKFLSEFDREVVVPGLVDMAKPEFIEPGPKVAERSVHVTKRSEKGCFLVSPNIQSVRSCSRGCPAEDWQGDVRYPRIPEREK